MLNFAFTNLDMVYVMPQQLTPSRYTFPLSALALALASLSTQGYAADSSTTADTPQQVTVTGSRISRAQKEGATSVTVITSAELEKKGYSNAFDALNGLTQNTGFTQGADYGNTFTPAANAISLRGLGPNHTLTLIDGHRVADYPVPYDGSENFVNLANIPTAMVDRIEILNGGASAIYGSDAIAGVVNIILKKKFDGVEVNVKGGGTSHGGENLRFQLSGGKTWDDLNLVYGLEVSGRNPIWARQRDFMSDRTRLGETPTVVLGRKDAESGKYLNLGGCNSAAGLFGGSVSSIGNRCVSGKASPDFWTVQTLNQSENGYFSLDYALNEHTQLFGNLLFGFNHTENNTRGPSWTSAANSSSYFLNQATGGYESWTKRFAPEEVGGVDHTNKEWDDTSANLTFGVRGDIGDSTWKYETSYSGSTYTSKASVYGRLLSGADNYFLGPKLGVDPDGVPIYNPNVNRLSQPLTPTEFESISGRSIERDKSWLHTISASANGELFDLPAGAVKLAGVAEYGRQGFSNTPDALINQGAFYNASQTNSFGGTRTRQAVGTELFIPVSSLLNVNFSGRYDRYALSDSSIDKFTYGSSFEFRPAKTLLFRGNYASSFRAPDMNYLYLKEQRGYYSNTTDYWRCKQAGQPLSTCDFNNMSPGANYTLTGNQALKPEDGKSFGFGFVWSPTKKFDLSVDYWDITINNLVTNLDADKILRNEADCRSGIRDINSSLCQDAISRVVRNPDNAVVDPGVINHINVIPINAAREHVAGVDLVGKLRWDSEDFGNFLWTTNYTQVVRHTYQQSGDDPKDNYLADLTNTDWPNKLNTSLTWNLDKVSSTVLLSRNGKIPNGEQTGYLKPGVTVNWSASYKITPKATVSLIVNNVFNTIKRDDTGGWPYYPVGSYSPFGRQGWLEFNYHF